jgi:hypothetical protein
VPTVEEDVVEGRPGKEPEPPRSRPARLAVLWGSLAYAVLGVVVLLQLWISPSTRVLKSNIDDHGFFLFVMSHGERVLFHGENPLLNTRMNVPDGVNMMANTTVLALTLPFAPVTHFFGPGVTLALLLTLGLAGTAAAWWFVLRRFLVRSQLAAWIGGLWCGFAPTMVSHANGHVNFVSNFVVPFIVWQVLRLREPGRLWRGGVPLGLLIVLQVFINEEVLLFTAMTFAVFVIAYSCFRFAEVKRIAGRFTAGLGVAAVTAGVLLAYPMYWQFTGTGSYKGQPFEPGKFVTDLLSLGAYARQSLGGNVMVAKWLSISPTEENTFFGLPMLAMLVVAGRMLWHDIAARSMMIAGLVMLVASMGPSLQIAKQDTGIPLPFALIQHVPIIDLVSVTRFAMVPATLIGVLIALACDRARTGKVAEERLHWFWVGIAVAVIPVLPKPLPVITPPPPPAFIADGMYRDYVAGDRTVVTVPIPEVTVGRSGMRWFALSGEDYRVPRGYFMGPVAPPSDLTGSWNAPRRPTADLLTSVQVYGSRPVLSAANRQDAIADLTYWRAGVVVLDPAAPQHDLVESVLTDLIGTAPREIGGAQVWDVRSIVTP